MKFNLSILLLGALLAVPLVARERINLAEDEASHSSYNGGWNNGGNSAASGFGGWRLETSGKGQGESHSGFIIARRDGQSTLDHVDIGNKAFAIYANGNGFEAATAFRNIDQPLAPGDSFSFLMEPGDFAPKFGGDDPKPGYIGAALRTGTASNGWQDFNKQARFEIGATEGRPNFIVRDAEAEFDTGVTADGSGVAVTVTLVSADAYDLEVTALATKVTRKFSGRRLGGPKGAPIESFAICNQDGEKGDAYFNGFQVTRVVDSIPR